MLVREALIDTAAISANVRQLRSVAKTSEFIAVVKADGYGHGALRAARAAVAGGATRIGVADVAEALAIRSAGLVEVPVLCWLHDPNEMFDSALAADIELGITSVRQLQAVSAAADRRPGRPPAAVHLKVETGLGRGGAAPQDWAELFALAVQYQRQGTVNVIGLFSHLSGASKADDLEQVQVFTSAVEQARLAGLTPELVHLAATAATISLPEARFTAVRVGLGIYGLSPFADQTSADLGLRPAMTVQAPVIAVRRVAAGHGVSYDYTYRTSKETALALVPLGYADGVARHASGTGQIFVNGRSYQICGRVAMDQVVIDVGDDPVSVGDQAVLFGDPVQMPGVASAAEWALSAGTINYEIVTRIGPRVLRREI